MKLSREDSKNALTLLAIVAIAGFIYGGYLLYTLSQENKALQQEIAGLEEELIDTESALEASIYEGNQLSQQLQSEQDRLNSIRDQLEDVTNTVTNLERLNELDPELLQKYSKVYFLNEHYTPDEFYTIDREEYLYYEDKPIEIHERVWPYLRSLLVNAQDDGIQLFLVSGYRSFGEQSELKSGYVVTYGAGTANTFSAEQGYSEHQLGTTVDFMTTGISGTFSGFENTEAYQWLLENAHKYGFVLSYPKGNSYYQFEPWHWRFVGEELAEDLYESGRNFYDLEQREIDEYLLHIFD